MTFSSPSSASAPDVAAIAAALQWWREAGVEHSYADDAASWLAPPEVKSAAAPAAYVAPPPPAPPPRPLIGGDPAQWPQDLASFQTWWLSELSLDAAPRGRFEGENPNVFNGEDLDLPPFLRKKK